jgi:hypothetical protein
MASVYEGGKKLMLNIGEQTGISSQGFVWSGCFEQVARSVRKVPSVRIEIRNKGGITFTVN